MKEDEQDKRYDLDELKRLWKLNYKQLAMAPGQPNGRLRGFRFVMQAKAALETRRITFVMALATVAMTIATIAMAVAAFRN